MGEYDHSRPLVIDPLVYSTYIGGSNLDYGYGIAVDGSGNAYVTGYTWSIDYDTTSGSFQTANDGWSDVFVAKLCMATPTFTSAPGTDNQTLCINTPIIPITYAASCAVGTTFSGLPDGVTGSFTSGTITISGTPTAAGTYNYSVSLSGGCGNVSTTGVLVIAPEITISAQPSYHAPLNNHVSWQIPVENATSVIVSNLPDGLTYSFDPGTQILTIYETANQPGSFVVQINAANAGCVTSTSPEITVLSSTSVNNKCPCFI